VSQSRPRPRSRSKGRAGAGGRVAFVCQHGALRSRIAAAFFNAWAPVGWSATSAGVKPQSQPSTRLVKVMAGTDAEEFVDRARPRSIADIPTSESRVIAIDTLVPDAESWSTKTRREPGDAALRDEISRQVRALVNEIAATQLAQPE
jgi:Low molecular weight phosphotyrosine protein phosphatase